jgi:hypothetical protein
MMTPTVQLPPHNNKDDKYTGFEDKSSPRLFEVATNVQSTLTTSVCMK